MTECGEVFADDVYDVVAKKVGLDRKDVKAALKEMFKMGARRMMTKGKRGGVINLKYKGKKGVKPIIKKEGPSPMKHLYDMIPSCIMKTLGGNSHPSDISDDMSDDPNQSEPLSKGFHEAQRNVLEAELRHLDNTLDEIMKLSVELMKAEENLDAAVNDENCKQAELEAAQQAHENSQLASRGCRNEWMAAKDALEDAKKKATHYAESKVKQQMAAAAIFQDTNEKAAGKLRKNMELLRGITSLPQM